MLVSPFSPSLCVSHSLRKLLKSVENFASFCQLTFLSLCLAVAHFCSAVLFSSARIPCNWSKSLNHPRKSFHIRSEWTEPGFNLMLTDTNSLRWRFGWFIQTGFRTLTLVWIKLNGLKVWSISEGCPSSWQIKTLKVICSYIRRLKNAEDSPCYLGIWHMLCLDRKKKRLWHSYDHYWWASVSSIKRLLI